MNKKNKIKDLVENVSIDCLKDEIIDLLNLELQINEKKINNEELTNAEYLFDNYCVKPSFLLRHIMNRVDKK